MRNPFRRKNNQTIAELESYYATQGKSHDRGRAWLMAIVSLIVTVLVIAGLFFAVRWAYRTLTDDSADSDTVATGTVEGDGSATVIGDGSSDPRSSEDIVAGVLNPSEDTTDSDSSETEEGGVVSDEAASTTRDVAGSSSGADADSTITNTGPDGLPNTGPGESLAVILLTTTAIGYAMSRRFQKR